MNKKGKIFSLIAVSGAMLFSFAFLAKPLIEFTGASALSNYEEEVNTSISFTEESRPVSSGLTNRYYSRAQSEYGAELYLISVYPSQNINPDGSVLNFSDSKSNAVTFFVSEYQDGIDPETGLDAPYRFQNVNSVSFGIGYLGSCYGNYINAPTARALDATESKSMVLTNKALSFEKAGRVLKFTNVYFLIAGKASSVTFNYSCDYSYTDVPHSVTKSYDTSAGTIAITSDSTLYEGEECKFSFNPNSSSDLTLNHFYIVDHPEIEILSRKEGIFQKDVYYFTMPNFDVTLSAIFDEPVKYSLTCAPTVNGSISIETSQYKAGATASFVVTPDSGFVIENVSATPTCEFSIQGNTYNFTMPTSDVVVSASFVAAPESHNVSISQSIEHGTVTSDKATYYEGETVTLTVTPDSGYEIEEVTIDGDPISPVNDIYLFNMPNHDVVVSAKFKNGGIVVDLYNVLSKAKISGVYSDQTISFTFNQDKTATQSIVKGFVSPIYSFNYELELVSGTKYNVKISNATKKSGTASGVTSHVLNCVNFTVTFSNDLTEAVSSYYEFYSSTYGSGGSINWNK